MSTENPGTEPVSSTESVGSYLQYLPAVFQEGFEHNDFLGRFLLAFEHLLTGLGDPESPGLEEILHGIESEHGIENELPPIESLFSPLETPSHFLPWLAGWVALPLHENHDERRQRKLLARAVELYRKRGTVAGLTELLQIETGLPVTIVETHAMRLGVRSTVGVDTWLDGGPPHTFRVVARLPTPDPAELRLRTRSLRALIDQHKPAHTTYSLDIEVPSFQIGVHSTVGFDTLVG